MLKTGQAAPVFVLPDADMEEVDLASFRSRNNVVLYFYPRDDTPGCTLEATDFSDLDAAFASADFIVLGVSRDDCITHAAFRDKYGISVRLLSDAEGAVCRQYGVWQAKEVDGHKKFGIVRSTFIIDKNGVLRHAMYGVNAKGHAQEILRMVREFS